MIKEEIKEIIGQILWREFQLKLPEGFSLESPPEVKLGDLAVPCFVLAKAFNLSPSSLAIRLAKKLNKYGLIKKAEASGGYLNLFLEPEALFSATVGKVLEQAEKFGQSDSGKDQEIILEYSSPNTNKPLHIGHLRNNFLGDSLARVLGSQGFKVRKVNTINDRGIHIAKSMLMYQKEGQGRTPKDLKMKPDHFVGYFYQRFADKYLPEAQALLRKWEQKDKATIKLWKKMNSWAYCGLKKSYQAQAITFDKIYYESEIYEQGKEMVTEGLNSGLFYQRDDKAMAIDLTREGLDKKVLIRADGTSLYITQDLYLAKLRSQEFPRASKFIYVVGREQEYHFKVLFSILKKLGLNKAFYHLRYGLVRLASGKMSSRAGTAISADKLMKAVMEKASSRLVGKAALRYYLLQASPSKDLRFDINKALSFEGDTGPYLLYSYARAKSILKKVKPKGILDFSLLGEEIERELALLLDTYPGVLSRAAKAMDPSLLAEFLFHLAQSFNRFYHQHQVVKAKKELARVRASLVQAVSQTLKNGCQLLGIEVLEKM